MRKLFLDDSRLPPDFTWDVVRSYEEFIAYIELHGVPDVISFDHDLGTEHYQHYCDVVAYAEIDKKLNEVKIPYEIFQEKTGYDCAKWLIEQGQLPKNYLVHSMNPVGKMNITFVMDAAYKRYVGPSANG